MSAASVASYIAYQCTWYVARALDWVQPGWGNADEWAASAARAGFQVTQTPTVGSIAVWSGNLAGSGGAGHVAVVTGLVPGGFTVSEENFTYPSSATGGRPDTRTVTGSGLQDLIGFIQPPGGGSSVVDPNNIPSDAVIASNPLGLLAELAGKVPGAPSASQAASSAATGLGLAALGQEIAGIPTQIGHGLAGALSASLDDVATWGGNQVVPLVVALVVALVLFL